MSSHLLILKVMRLSRPGLATKNPFAFDRNEQQTTESLISTQQQQLLVPTHPELGMTSFLTLASSFGNIYLGETFTAYLSVTNDSSIPVNAFNFKAELQTMTQRFVLVNTSSAGNSPRTSVIYGSEISLAPDSLQGILPGQSAEFTITHEIKELGVHILVCSVQYKQDGSDQPQYFRKFYKFEVLNPLSVKTKTHTLPDGRVTLEAQVKNLCGTGLYLERLRFEPNPLFDFQDLNLGESGGVFDEMLSSQDTRQYLYLICPKHGDLQGKMTPQLGKLDIAWQSSFGQVGKLGTSALVRKVVHVDAFDVRIVEATRISAEEPFRLKLRLRNYSEQVIRAQVKASKDKMTSILLNGPNNLTIGNVDPGSHQDFDMDFFALAPGTFRIDGLELIDQVSGLAKEIDLATIRVI